MEAQGADMRGTAEIASEGATSALEQSSTGAPAMVVAVEATRLTRELRGIGRYVRALLPRLVTHRPGLRLELFVRRGDIDAVSRMVADNPAMLGRVDVRPAREITRSKADVFWYPWNIAGPSRAEAPVVVTMHDVAPIALPDPRLLRWRKNLRWRLRYAATARRATIIVADSAFTADEVQRLLGYPRARMHVVLLAADDVAPPPAAGDAAALERLGVKRPFVLTVGAADPRKNLALVQRAMPQVLARHPGLKLVLAGPRPRTEQDAERPWQQTLGFVSEAELAALYRTAEVLVMPSTYEGFGLPVLEAMRLGTPVIAARASSLPEVGGDAAAWVEPHDDVRLAAMISKVLSDAHTANAMRAASRAQAARFSWDDTARRTIAAFDHAAKVAAADQR
jgi:glycosyltransferase involved in cell wall biosynthesis